MEEPASKDELIRTLKTERQRWEELLNEVGPNRTETSGVTGDWSVKDIIAHVNAWEERLVAWLEAIALGTSPELPPWPANLDEDATNAWIWKVNRGRRLDEVLAESRRTSERVEELLAAVTEQDLKEPGRLWWLSGASLLASIPGHSYAHRREHADAIRHWLAGRAR